MASSNSFLGNLSAGVKGIFSPSFGSYDPFLTYAAATENDSQSQINEKAFNNNMNENTLPLENRSSGYNSTNFINSSPGIENEFHIHSSPCPVGDNLLNTRQSSCFSQGINDHS